MVMFVPSQHKKLMVFLAIVSLGLFYISFRFFDANKQESMGRGSSKEHSASPLEQADPTLSLKDDMPADAPTPALEIVDVQEGTGALAESGKVLSVHYVLKLEGGSEIDHSRKNGKAFSFTLGEGQVIKGWEKGLVGMKVGGKRRLVVPPVLGYGRRGISGLIPPEATLIFEIELLAVE